MILSSVPWWDILWRLWERHQLTSEVHFLWGEVILITQVSEA